MSPPFLRLSVHSAVVAVAAAVCARFTFTAASLPTAFSSFPSLLPPSCTDPLPRQLILLVQQVTFRIYYYSSLVKTSLPFNDNHHHHHHYHHFTHYFIHSLTLSKKRKNIHYTANGRVKCCTQRSIQLKTKQREKERQYKKQALSAHTHTLTQIKTPHPASCALLLPSLRY